MKSKLPSAPYKNDFPFVISCDVPFHPPPPNAPKPNEDKLFIIVNKSNFKDYGILKNRYFLPGKPNASIFIPFPL